MKSKQDPQTSLANPHDPGPADSWRVLASILLAISIYVAAAWAFHALYRPPPVDASEFLPECRSGVRPEPEERALYLLGLACIATLPTALYAMFRRLGRQPGRLALLLERPRWLLVRDAVVLLAAVRWLYWLAEDSDIGRTAYLLTFSLLFLCLVPLWSRLCRGVQALTGSKVAVVAAIAAILFTETRLMIIDNTWFASRNFVNHHFDVILGAVNQAWHGKTILVDTTSQYGVLYPYVAAWSLAPFGLSVKSLSMFFAFISLLCWGFAYAAAGRKAGYGSVATLALVAAFLGVTHTIPAGMLASSPEFSVYYQFFPLRVVSGMFFLWFVPIYLRWPRPRLLAVGYVAGGLSLLWNADSGVVVLGAWYALHVFRAIGQWRQGGSRMAGRIVGHGALTVVTAVLAVAAYMLFARLRSGRFPDLAAFSEYQRIFYANGYFMLPMKLREIWQPVILLYLAVVAWSLRRAIWQDLTTDAAWYFFIAIFGLGEFSYYQGRSHADVLPSTFYPAVFLSFLVAYDGWQAVRSVSPAELFRDPQKRWILLGTAFYAIGFAFGLVNFCRAIPATVTYAMHGPPQRESKVWPELPGVKGVILMNQSANFLHVATGSQTTLPFASASEVMLLRQVPQVQAALDGADTQFVLLDTRFPVVRYLDLGKFQRVWQSRETVLLTRKR
jgi:hypothetical protein